ncbi:MAG: hypothetical protein R6V52_08775 [Bacteroidales bacterium]
MKKNVVFALLIILALKSFAQIQLPEWVDSLDVTPYGYVKLDAFYDSRETVNGREGHFLLWPAPPEYDLYGNDLADKPSFNMLAVQTNMGLSVQGPEIFNATTSALIEGDYFGQRNDNVNLLRLRHAYFTMQWEKTGLLVGQFWNPVFNLEAFPWTVSFTTGTPVLPFSRNPQIRLTQELGDFTLMAVVLSQRDYPSYGPDPDNPEASIPSSQFIKNSGMPEFHAKAGWKKQSGQWTLKSGIGGGYKRIMPRTVSDVNAKTDVTVPGHSLTAYVSAGKPGFRFAGGAVYGNNATDVMTPGGFAVSGITDTANNFVEYTTLASGSLWADISGNTGNLHLGIFGGYLKHLGAEKEIAGNTWGLANNMAYLYRIAPRVWYQKKAFRVSFEIEHTAAAFGEPDETGQVQNPDEVSNTRFLLGLYYFFNQKK